MMDRVKISAVIPTYNGEKFIEETLNSVLNQSRKLDEIIIIDDNSEDNTVHICELYSQKCSNISVIKNKVNKGSSESRNIGIQKSKNDYVFLMDQDDIVLPTLLEKELKKINELKIKYDYNNWIGAHSAYLLIDEDESLIGKIDDWKQVNADELIGYEFVRNHMITNSGMLLNRSIVVECGMFDKKLKYSQDWDLWLKMCREGGFAYVDEPLIKLRRHEQNTSKDVSNFLQDEINILKKYDLDFIKESVLKRKLSLENNLIDFASILYKLYLWNDGLKILKDCLEINRNSCSANFYIGVYYIHVNDMDNAINSFRKVIAIDSKHGAALNNLGVLYLLKGNKIEGVKYLKNALDLFNNYNDAKFNLDNIQNFYAQKFKPKFTLRELRKSLITYKS